MLKILLSCEHGGNKIPLEIAKQLKVPIPVLQSHCGMDFGALEVSRFLARHLEAHWIPNDMTRLVVDFNRSPHHPQLFSQYSRNLVPERKEQILKKYYWPYREKIERKILKWKKQKFTVLHLSIHSFTPRFKGQTRRGDLAWLYDPKRNNEKLFSRKWRRVLGEYNPKLRLRFNYPYLGIADGLIPWLRKRHPRRTYWGIELEINQGLWRIGGAPWRKFRRDLLGSLEDILS